ncbi:MAG: D-2-hydroxyacid dehydrogenase [Betaproteobacteria bacterium]|nr:D-2-hydroxyacid dehydrogenase [Betaproteobacteria bacterium]
MKVVFWPYLAKAEMLERFGKIAGMDLVLVDSADSLIAAISGAEALVVSQTAYDERVANVLREHAKRLRFIQLMNAGYDGPSKHGVPPGVVVAKAGDAWSPALAEHAMTLMLSLIRCMPQILENQSKRGWDRKFTARIDGIDGKTLAIIGYGSIGREVAKRAKPFGMHVIGVSRTAAPKPFADETEAVSALHAVLAHADVIVLTAPLSAETRYMIDAKALSVCKPNAILINVARGGLIDQTALGEALKNGTIAAAGLDVTDPEPLPPDHPLWLSPNLIISPHVAGSSGARGRERLADFVAENLGRFVAGEAVTHTVTL